MSPRLPGESARDARRYAGWLRKRLGDASKAADDYPEMLSTQEARMKFILSFIYGAANLASTDLLQHLTPEKEREGNGSVKVKLK